MPQSHHALDSPLACGSPRHFRMRVPSNACFHPSSTPASTISLIHRRASPPFLCSALLPHTHLSHARLPVRRSSHACEILPPARRIVVVVNIGVDRTLRRQVCIADCSCICKTCIVSSETALVKVSFSHCLVTSCIAGNASHQPLRFSPPRKLPLPPPPRPPRAEEAPR